MTCHECGSRKMIKHGSIIACFDCHAGAERTATGWITYDGDKQLCKHCGTPLIERDGQDVDDLTIVRRYCEHCGKAFTEFEITTENPLADTNALIQQ